MPMEPGTEGDSIAISAMEFNDAGHVMLTVMLTFYR